MLGNWSKYLSQDLVPSIVESWASNNLDNLRKFHLAICLVVLFCFSKKKNPEVSLGIELFDPVSIHHISSVDLTQD